MKREWGESGEKMRREWGDYGKRVGERVGR